MTVTSQAGTTGDGSAALRISAGVVLLASRVQSGAPARTMTAHDSALSDLAASGEPEYQATALSRASARMCSRMHSSAIPSSAFAYRRAPVLPDQPWPCRRTQRMARRLLRARGASQVR